MNTSMPVIAYFSMEVGLEPTIPTYAGGLGMLAGDTIRAAADLELPMVGMTLVHRHGYFRQRLDEEGGQHEDPDTWPVEQRLEPMSAHVSVDLEDRSVAVHCWRYVITGHSGYTVPVYLLDTNLPSNSPWDRTLTDTLYGGDAHYRLCQEIILGLGGVFMLGALGYTRINRYHMNEGHSALLVLALLEEQAGDAVGGRDPIQDVRKRCVFTTHTPVPAGHDQFPSEHARRVIGARRWTWLKRYGQEPTLNMTDLALRGSMFVNGVAMRHGEVSRGMFPQYPIHSITNGVHAPTWISPPFQRLYDRHLPNWRKDRLTLRYAVSIPTQEIWDAHQEAKQILLGYIRRETGASMEAGHLLIGFARRATGYKRMLLLFENVDRLLEIAREGGPFAIVLAGKAHPRDLEGKDLIRRVFELRKRLAGTIPVVYLANYDMAVGQLLCSGVDVWLNTPLPPLEASGTSGMKAALNGVPSLSVLDGWWVEGHLEDITGWSIGHDVHPREGGVEDLTLAHATDIYEKLSTKILPCFYNDLPRFSGIMRSTIAVNGGFFHTQRMLKQYIHNAYDLTWVPREPEKSFKSKG